MTSTIGDRAEDTPKAEVEPLVDGVADVVNHTVGVVEGTAEVVDVTVGPWAAVESGRLGPTGRGRSSVVVLVSSITRA